jgi:hypothetical protein
MTEHGQAPAMREKGQGTDSMGDLQFIAKRQADQRLRRSLSAKWRLGIEKPFYQRKVCGGDTKSAVDDFIADCAGTDEGHIDTFLGNTLDEIDKGSIGGRKHPVRNMDKFLTELYSPYADLHYPGL